MKTNNYYLRVISEKLNNKEYLKPWTDNHYLKEILDSYGVSYGKVYANVKYLFDWCKELTGDSSLKTGNSGLFYLKTIAKFLDSGVSLNKSVNYYLRVISELIDSKDDSSVSLFVSSVSPYVADSVVLSGVLVPAGGTVKLYDGETLLDTIETDSTDGSFSKSWTATFGAHSFKAVFEETEEYRGSESEIIDVNVVKKSTVLSLSAVDDSIFVDDNLVLSGSLLWNNVGVSGASVKLYQDDVLLDTLTTGNDGSFTKTVTGLQADTYEYYVVYDGTDVYEQSASDSLSVEVSKYATSLSLNVPMNLVYSDSFNLSGVLVDENNNVLGSKSIKLLVDNTEKASTNTDSTGTASFTQTPVRTGNHDFKLSFAGDYKYEATASSVVSRVVDKETSVLSLSAPLDNSSHYVNDDISVVGSLLEDDGVVMKSKSIMVGDKGTVTTGNDGAFTKTISYDVKGTKTLTVSYAGDENYTASSVTRTLTLLQKTPVITVAGSESEIYTNETVTVSGTLKYNNNPVKNHSVKIYDGSTLLDTVTTNANGEYTKTVSGLTKGIHTLKAVSVETNEYESVTSSNVSVEVFNIITGVTIESDKSIISGYHSETCTLTAKLIDSDGAVVTKDNLNITFKKDGTAIGSAVATTDGVATKTFTASNGGELELRADYSTFHDTCTVEDIYAYQTLTADDGNWTKETGVNATFNNNGLTVTSSTNAGKFMRWGVNPPSYYSTEVEIKNLGSESFSASMGIEDAYIMNNNTENKILGNRVTYSASESFTVSPKLNVGDIVKMVFDGYNIVFYRSGNYVGVIHKGENLSSVFFRTYGPRVLTVKNLKMRSLDLHSVALASDKSVLSYYHSDTCTLSATVKDTDGNPVACEGIGVKFYKGANLLGTAYTNSNGVATYTYNAADNGNVSLTAKIGTDITSNSVTIEDIYYYTDGKTDLHDWETISGVQITYTSKGIKATSNATKVNRPKLNITLPSYYSVEAKVTEHVISTATTGLVVEGATLFGIPNYFQSTFEGGTVQEAAKVSPALANGDVLKIVYTGSNVSTHRNNSFIKGYIADSSYDGVRFRMYNGRSITLTDFKIKSLDLSSVALASDKSVLSSYHSDTATLTATVKDSNGNPVACEGIGVKFYKGANLLGTAYTNSNGVATYTYTSADNGNVSLTAKIGTDITSNSVTIEDIYYYTDGKTDLHDWETISGVQITYTSKGIKATSNATKVNRPKLNITLPSYYSVEAKVVEWVINSTSTGLVVEGAHLAGITGYLQLEFEGGTAQGQDKVPPALANGDVLKIVYTGSNASAHRNNSFIKGYIADSSYDGVRFRTYNGRSITLTDFKIRSLDLHSVLLASDKSIVSYADGETCTLSATVKDTNGNAVACAGIGVKFYNGASLLGTSYTNSSGVATYTYNSAGVGDITVSAKAGNNIVSNNLTIEDCTKYDPCTSDSGNWNIPTAASITFDNTDGAYLVGTANNIVYPKYNLTYPTGDYSVEATVTKTVYDGNNVITRMGVNGVFVESYKSYNYIGLTNNTSGDPTITQPPLLNIGDVIRFEYDSTNSQVTVYRNNNLVGTKAITTGYNGIQFRSFKDRGLGIKNLKIKPI